MSLVYPILSGWVGYGGGADVQLREDVAMNCDHPAVKARPELFVPADGPTGRRGRPPGSRNKPKLAPEGGAADV